MGEWFIDWFNTQEYLDVYRHRNEQDAEELVNLILNNVPFVPGMRVLDMACGAGRHSILFAQRGCRVTAFDYSERLLQEARKRAARENVKIEFHKSDIRKFSFEKEFDLAVNLFTSFGYFKEDSENFNILRSTFEHLRTGGNFVLDFFNSEYLRNHLVHRSEDQINGNTVVQERYFEGNRVKKRITVQKDGHTELYNEDVRLYSYVELQKNLDEAGFKILKIFGDFKGNKYDSEKSPRVIIIASK